MVEHDTAPGVGADDEQNAEVPVDVVDAVGSVVLDDEDC
jgi:hypothetical protein